MAIARGWWKKIGSSFDWGYFLMNILCLVFARKLILLLDDYFIVVFCNQFWMECVLKKLFFLFFIIFLFNKNKKVNSEFCNKRLTLF